MIAAQRNDALSGQSGLGFSSPISGSEVGKRGIHNAQKCFRI
jgi:hypothetical protein